MKDSSFVSETLQVLKLVTSAFEQLKIQYYLTGSLASSVRGEFRATNDIDFVAQLNTEQAVNLAENLADTFFADPNAMKSAVIEARSFNMIHKETVLKVDIFTKIDPLSAQQLARATLVSLPVADFSARVATAEDIILAKLIWYRKGNEQSERQWRDVLGVLAFNRPTLDLDYLRTWAGYAHVSDLLDRALTPAP